MQGTFRKRKKPVGSSWKMDETYIQIKGEWMYLYHQNGSPVTINIDQSRANKEANRTYNNGSFKTISISRYKIPE